jgi:hypothetical protein
LPVFDLLADLVSNALESYLSAKSRSEHLLSDPA